MPWAIFITLSVSFWVIFRDAPSGRDMEDIMIPWSSSGTRDEGTIINIFAVTPTKRTNMRITIMVLLRKNFTPAE